MTPDELKALRRELGMTQEDFGEWIAREVNVKNPKRKPVANYTRQRVSSWESGDVDIPDRVKLILAERRIAQLEKQAQSQRRGQRQI